MIPQLVSELNAISINSPQNGTDFLVFQHVIPEQVILAGTCFSKLIGITE